jgi:adenosylcobinamide kinase / adenosylcobinamide-phosphate guanylyltransferase
MTRTLVLGGARSGKSVHAELLATATGKQRVYIATAHAVDTEMAARGEDHRPGGDGGWFPVEEPVFLADAITRHAAPDRVLLVDCLTVWLTNLLFTERRDYPDIGTIEPPAAFHAQRAALLHALAQAPGEVILVSNEVGMGIIPQGALSRWFVDEAGRLNQALAACCERAVFVAAGLPLTLKG